MDNVVYILGAGFSAPLGLPVMANFIEKAHDIYKKHREEYPNFGYIFQKRREKLAWIAQIYKADLDNIEEVLSILEMERLAGTISPTEANEFHKFIIDVIKYFTPPIKSREDIQINSKGTYESTRAMSEDEVLGSIIKKDYYFYGKFVLGLCNAKIHAEGIWNKEESSQQDKHPKEFNSFKIKCEQLSELQAQYSVISLNYDLILESLANYYSTISDGYKINFLRPQTKNSNGFPVLAKLHGSIDTNTIIPPTWNKTIQDKIGLEWNAAYQSLSSANHIRFIGYSLPDSDAYIKYLLKSSISNSDSLKSIDIVCLDPSNTTKTRYDNFITQQFYPKCHFVNGDTSDYLKKVSFNIERGHKNFLDEGMKKYSIG